MMRDRSDYGGLGISQESEIRRLDDHINNTSKYIQNSSDSEGPYIPQFPFLDQSSVESSGEQCCVTVVIMGGWTFQHVMLMLDPANSSYYIIYNCNALYQKCIWLSYIVRTKRMLLQ